MIKKKNTHRTEWKNQDTHNIHFFSLIRGSKHTDILTNSDCLEARPGEEYFSTKARVLKPNLWIGSFESKGGKSVSTSPSSSAM